MVTFLLLSLQHGAIDRSHTDDTKLFSLLGVSPALVSVLHTEHRALLHSGGDVTHYVTSSASHQIVYERARLLTAYRQRGFSVEQALHASRRLYMYYTDSPAAREAAKVVRLAMNLCILYKYL